MSAGGHRRQRRFEGGLVDDDVDHRFGSLAPGRRVRGGHEDGVEGIHSPLRGGAGKVRWRCAAVAESASGFVPVGLELRLAEPFEDLAHRRPLGDAALADDRVAVADPFDRGVAGGVGLLVAAMGTVGVGERFPAIDEQAELVEAQRLGVLQHDVGTVGELLTATRVGSRPCQLAHLGDPDGAGGEGRRRRRRGPTATAPCGCGGWSRRPTS